MSERQIPPAAPTPPWPGPAPILALRGAGFRYPSREVLRGVDLEIHSGERLAVLGANGSGKSTLLRLLAAALQATSGRLELDGRPVAHDRRGRNAVRRRVQLVLQDPDEQLFATSVLSDVSYGPANQGLPQDEVLARAEAAMAAAEITDLADRVPHQLSYGQRKRVALAGALAMEPEVLLLDEPTAGLDPAAVARLGCTLSALHDRGVAVVMATHDVDVAWDFADRAAVLGDGTVISGPADHVLVDPDVLGRARLSPPWAPLVSAALGRTVRSPADLL